MKKPLIFAFLIICGISTEPQGQDKELDIEYLYTIGEDLEFGEPGFLINPHRMSSHKDGTIFISDHSTKSVNKYSKDGKFLNSFGRSGRGPGEFREISAIAIDENGNLLVHDRMSFKMARFNIEGDSIEEHLYEDMNQINMMTLAALPDNRFAGVYIESGPPGSLNEDLKAIRVYEFGDGETESTHFEIFKHQFDFNHPLEQRLAGGVGHSLTALSDNQLVVGHRVYTGKLSAINLETNEVTSFENETIRPPYYLEFDIESRSERPDIDGLGGSYGQSGSFMYQILFYSMMLGHGQDMLFHIFKRNEAEGKTLSKEIEIYSKDGTLLLHEDISDFFPESDDFRYSFMHVDENLRLYVNKYHNRNDPEVQVYQLSLSDSE